MGREISNKKQKKLERKKAIVTFKAKLGIGICIVTGRCRLLPTVQVNGIGSLSSFVFLITGHCPTSYSHVTFHRLLFQPSNAQNRLEKNRMLRLIGLAKIFGVHPSRTEIDLQS